MFLPQAWGHGYANEACAAALAWFDGALPGEPLVLCTQLANDRAMRPAAKPAAARCRLSSYAATTGVTNGFHFVAGCQQSYNRGEAFLCTLTGTFQRLGDGRPASSSANRKSNHSPKHLRKLEFSMMEQLHHKHQLVVALLVVSQHARRLVQAGKNAHDVVPSPFEAVPY